MLAHLVGGPAHGDDIALSGVPHPTIEVPKLEESPILPYYTFDDMGDSRPVAGPFETHVYRLLHSDSRTAIYKWQPPRVEGTWEFTIQCGAKMHSIYDRLHELESSEGEAVKTLSIEYDGREVRVRGIVLVDGPADPTAAKEAAAAVQSLIDRKLRRYRITGFVVEVNDG